MRFVVSIPADRTGLFIVGKGFNVDALEGGVEIGWDEDSIDCHIPFPETRMKYRPDLRRQRPTCRDGREHGISLSAECGGADFHHVHSAVGGDHPNISLAPDSSRPRMLCFTSEEILGLPVTGLLLD